MLSPDSEAIIVQAWLNVAYQAEDAESKRNLPSILLRPRLSIDGDLWCALYGENLQDGVAGFGKSPADAFHDFDRAWSATLAPHPEPVIPSDDDGRCPHGYFRSGAGSCPMCSA